MELEVRHLRLICAIAETGSLTRAAAALSMAQPGLTAQLQRIERSLGGPLFTRDTHGAVPTALGELVLSRARAVLPALDDLRIVSALSPADSLTTLRLGSVNARFTAGLVARLRDEFPDAACTTRTESSSTPLLDLVAAGRLELAVVGDSPGYGIGARPGVTLLAVHTEPLFALLPGRHPLAARPVVDLADLAACEWTLPEHDDDRIREYFSEVLDRAGVEPRVAHQVEGNLVFDLIRALGIVSLCQATCVPPEGVVSRPLAGDPLWYRHLLALNPLGPLAAHTDRLTELARAAYEDSADRSATYTAWRAGRQPPR
ncbi:LysR family transcriptional regulator [Longispora urticae]